MALTEDAKKEIADAIRIVREDRFEAYARTSIGKHTAKVDPPKDPLIEPDDPPKNDPINPPPKKDDPPKNDPNPDEPPKRHSAYWGEILD